MLRVHYLRPEPNRVLGITLRDNWALLAGLLLWGVAMFFLASLASLGQPSDAAADRWIGVRAVEGGLFYARFDDKQACQIGMAEESLVCVSGIERANGSDAELQ